MLSQRPRIGIVLVVLAVALLSFLALQGDSPVPTSETAQPKDSTVVDAPLGVPDPELAVRSANRLSISGPTEPTSLTPSAAEEPESDSPHLKIRVLGERGGVTAQPVPGVEFRWSDSKQNSARKTSDARGELWFEAEPDTSYDLELSTSSLPEGLLLNTSLVKEREPWKKLQNFVLRQAEPSPVYELSLSSAREISGWVANFPSGTGETWNAVASLLVTPHGGVRQVQELRAPLDAQGRFRLAPLPGQEYLVHVEHLSGPSLTPPSGFFRSPRQFVDLRELPSAEVIFRFPGAGGTIHGRVLSEEGEPVPGLDVRAYYLELGEHPRPDYVGFNWADSIGNAWTDELGRYEISGFVEGTAAIQVGADVMSNRFDGPRKLATGPPRLLVESSGEAERIEVPDVRVFLSHAYQVSGVVLDASTGQPSKFRNLELLAEFTSPKIPIHEGWGTQSEPRVRVQRLDGSFALECDTPAPDIRLVLRDRRSGEIHEERILAPVPDEVVEGLELTHP